MKKLFFILLIVTGVKEISRAQTPGWLWAEAETGGSCYMQGTGIWAAPSGSVYMNGRFSGTLSIGGKEVYTSNSSQAFSGKMNSSGNFSWLALHPAYVAYGNDYCYGFGGDSYGNTYSTGLINSGSGIFADAYDSTGMEIWSKSFTPTSGSMQGGGFAITADKDKNAYVTGGYGGTIDFGPVTLTASGHDDMFLAKIDNAGNCVWAVDAGPVGAGEEGLNDGGRGVAVDGAGNIYVCGSYTGTTSFGNGFTLPTTGTNNFFIAKYNNAGAPLWVQTATNAGFVNPELGFWWTYNGLAIDSCSNIYVTGCFINTAKFGGLSVTSAGGADIFVAKCLANGQWEWVQRAGGANNDLGQALTLDKHNDIYITGYYEGTAAFGSQSISTVAAQNVFVAKYANSNGAFQWIQAPVDTGFITGTGVTVDKQGFTYVTGDFGSAPNHIAVFGADHITGLTSCGQNVFVAKVDTAPARNIVPLANRNYCPGETIALPYTATGTFNNGNAFTAQLSNDSGSFISAVTLGFASSTASGSIDITIPGNTPVGSGYLIRIVSSLPAGSSYSGCSAYITIGGSIGTPVVSNDTSICSGTSLQLHASGGSTYSWSPGIAFDDSTSADPTLVKPLNSQIYKVNISSGSCVGKTVSVAVIVIPGGTISVSPADTTICSGAALGLNVTGASSYIWSPATGLNCVTCANPIAMPDSSVTYSVTGGSGICRNTLTMTVAVSPGATGGIVTAVRDTICQGTPGNLTLAGNSANHIEWQSSADKTNFTNVGDTASKYKTNPLQQTTWYRVAVGSGNCSALSDTFKLIVPPALTANFNYTQPTPTQLNFNSDSSGGSIRSYHWDFGDGTTSTEQNPSHTYDKDSTYYVCLTLYDGSNCSYTFCRYSLVTGTPTVAAMGNWVVYPNPFNEQLSVNSKQTNSQIQSIEMYDVLGRVVVNKNFNNTATTSLQLDVSSLAKGMYYVMIRTADADYVQKVVKQ